MAVDLRKTTFSAPLARPLRRSVAIKTLDAVSWTDRPCAKIQLNPLSSFEGDAFQTDRQTEGQTDRAKKIKVSEFT